MRPMKPIRMSTGRMIPIGKRNLVLINKYSRNSNTATENISALILSAGLLFLIVENHFDGIGHIFLELVDSGSLGNGFWYLFALPCVPSVFVFLNDDCVFHIAFLSIFRLPECHLAQLSEVEGAAGGA